MRFRSIKQYHLSHKASRLGTNPSLPALKLLFILLNYATFWKHIKVVHGYVLKQIFFQDKFVTHNF